MKTQALMEYSNNFETLKILIFNCLVLMFNKEVSYEETLRNSPSTPPPFALQIYFMLLGRFNRQNKLRLGTT